MVSNGPKKAYNHIPCWSFSGFFSNFDFFENSLPDHKKSLSDHGLPDNILDHCPCYGLFCLQFFQGNTSPWKLFCWERRVKVLLHFFSVMKSFYSKQIIPGIWSSGENNWTNFHWNVATLKTFLACYCTVIVVWHIFTFRASSIPTLSLKQNPPQLPSQYWLHSKSGFVGWTAPKYTIINLVTWFIYPKSNRLQSIYSAERVEAAVNTW
jgi:hypothetical protein